MTVRQSDQSSAHSWRRLLVPQLLGLGGGNGVGERDQWLAIGFVVGEIRCEKQERGHLNREKAARDAWTRAPAMA